MDFIHRLFLYKITLIIVFNLVDKRAEYLSRFKRVIIFGNILTPISTAHVRQPYREYERIRSESGQSEGVGFFSGKFRIFHPRIILKKTNTVAACCEMYSDKLAAIFHYFLRKVSMKISISFSGFGSECCCRRSSETFPLFTFCLCC